MNKLDDDPLIRFRSRAVVITCVLLILIGLVSSKVHQSIVVHKQHDTEKNLLIDELNQQNNDLEQELKQSQEEIKELREEMESLKKKLASRNTFNGVLEGKISHYSRNGCLGCSANLTMANGEPLDDSRLTIAVPPGTFKMNTPVKVTNVTNGKSVLALVTDTGGFSKLGRVADLTPAVANALGTVTDKSHVRVEAHYGTAEAN